MSRRGVASASWIRARRTLPRRWDAIVIGAGVGGLVAASLLARRGGLRVLVLERHYALGGLTQTFSRRRFRFEVGVHYVGDVGHRRAPLGRLMAEATGDRLEWQPLPRAFDRISFEGEEVRIAGGLDALRDAYLRFAPGERVAIDRYLEDLRRCAREGPAYLLADPARRGRAPFRRFSDVTTAAHLEALGLSPRLAALATTHFGNYGALPEESSFAAHAMATAHYLGGAFFPVGGGDAISGALVAALEERGGRALVRAPVASIRRDGDRALGVRMEDGTELDAPIVISAAGARQTYGALLDEDAPEVGALREEVRAIGPSGAHTALYVGLSRTAAELGLRGENRWLSTRAELRAPARLERWIAGEEGPSGLFVSFPSANDPRFEARHPGRATLVASVLQPFSPWSGWTQTEAQRRPAGYEALKARLARDVLAKVRALAPEIEGAIEHVEMSSPLSTRAFTGHPSGETCGLLHSPARFRSRVGPRTPLRGLYLSGQDAWLCGVGGAAFGALACASLVLRRDLMRAVLFG